MTNPYKSDSKIGPIQFRIFVVDFELVQKGQMRCSKVLEGG